MYDSITKNSQKKSFRIDTGVFSSVLLLNLLFFASPDPSFPKQKENKKFFRIFHFDSLMNCKKSQRLQNCMGDRSSFRRELLECLESQFPPVDSSARSVSPSAKARTVTKNPIARASQKTFGTIPEDGSFYLGR